MLEEKPETFREHNKSQLGSLSFLGRKDEELFGLWNRYFLSGDGEPIAKYLQSDNVGTLKTSCFLREIKKKRVTLNGTDVCYDYQLAAFVAFGRKELEKVASNKSGNSLTISHRCGTRDCFNPFHLELIPKRLNDERTHCHRCLQHGIGTLGFHNAIYHFHLGGFCPHGESVGLCYDPDVFFD